MPGLFARVAVAALGIGALATVISAQAPQGGGRYAVSDKAVRWDTQSAPVAVVTIRDNVSGETRRIEAPLDPQEVWTQSQGGPIEAVVVADRVAIVMPREPYCKEVFVVGLPSGKIVDSIMACNVSLSPDKTRVVYTYYGGRNIVDQVVLAYDVTRSPIDNASLGYLGRRFAPRGIVLFPSENRARGTYVSDSGAIDLVRSPVAWCKNDQIAFLAAAGDDTHLIEMSLPASASQANVIADQKLDAGAFRGSPTTEWPLERPLPPLRATELHYSDDCSSVTFMPPEPFAVKPVTLETAGGRP